MGCQIKQNIEMVPHLYIIIYLIEMGCHFEKSSLNSKSGRDSYIINYGFTVISKQFKENKKYVRYWIIKKLDITENQISIRPP